MHVRSAQWMNSMLLWDFSSRLKFPLEIEKVLKQVQSHLFDLGAVLAARPDYDPGVDLFWESEITWLENQIDNLDRELPALRQFILPEDTLRRSDAHGPSNLPTSRTRGRQAA